MHRHLLQAATATVAICVSALLCPVRSQADQEGRIILTGHISHKDVAHVAEIFKTTFHQSGISGVSEEIQKCYDSIPRMKSLQDKINVG